MENKEPLCRRRRKWNREKEPLYSREELRTRRKKWTKRKRGQLRKKNEKPLGFNDFNFSLLYSKNLLNWGLWVLFFWKIGAFFYSGFFLFFGGLKRDCLTRLRVEPTLTLTHNLGPPLPIGLTYLWSPHTIRCWFYKTEVRDIYLLYSTIHNMNIR